MERKTGSGLLFIPVLYALLILVFLFLHFSQFEEFSRQMKNVSYYGTMTKGRGIKPQQISKLTVMSNGLAVNFSASAPLTMISEDGIRRNLQIQDISRDENTLLLSFKYDTSIRISSDPVSNDSSLEFTIPKTRPPIKELQIQTDTLQPFQLTADEENRYMLTDGTSSFFLNMNQDFSFNPKSKILTISMVDRTTATLALEDEAPGLGRTVREWLTKEESTEKEYEELLARFIAASYNGWKSRFDKNLGTWALPDGNSSFDEKILVCEISEALKQGEYSLLLPDLLKAAEKNSSRLSWYSAPFTGDIVNRGAPLLRGNPIQLLRQLNTFQLEGNPEAPPYREILELAALLNNGEELDIEAWVEENLYPLIVWLEEGLFLFHPENPVCYSTQNIQAADMLIKAGEITGSNQLIRIGQKILISVLAKADENGFLPARITFSRERASQGEGFLRPEDIYSSFFNRDFNPRIIDLSNQEGAGSWLFTAAEDTRINSDNESVSIDLVYPKGQIHHIIISGIDPFDRILLHGIRWKSDPRFQRYSDGWVYDSVNKTLYVKLRQRAGREIIQIMKASADPEPVQDSQETPENPAETSNTEPKPEISS